MKYNDSYGNLERVVLGALNSIENKNDISNEDIAQKISHELFQEQMKSKDFAAFPMMGEGHIQDGITALDYFAAKDKAAITNAFSIDEDFFNNINFAATKENKTPQQVMAEIAYTGAAAMLVERQKHL